MSKTKIVAKAAKRLSVLMGEGPMLAIGRALGSTRGISRGFSLSNTQLKKVVSAAGTFRKQEFSALAKYAPQLKYNANQGLGINVLNRSVVGLGKPGWRETVRHEGVHASLRSWWTGSKNSASSLNEFLYSKLGHITPTGELSPLLKKINRYGDSRFWSEFVSYGSTNSKYINAFEPYRKVLAKEPALKGIFKQKGVSYSGIKRQFKQTAGTHTVLENKKIMHNISNQRMKTEHLFRVD